MTWRSGRPDRVGAAPVGDFGAAGHAAQVRTAVSGIIGNGVISFELAPQGTDGLDFLPKENGTPGNRPQLVLTVTSG
jgi:hypothetical protein